MKHSFLCVLLLAATIGHANSASANRNPKKLDAHFSDKIDKLLSRWNHRDTPGCALAILKDGRIVFERGYGMANLTYDIPNRPETRFQIASLSKQFTAFAIQLLIQDGELSLDDDARKYVPELPNFGKTLTIRHLLHHASGLRDQTFLLWFAGWRFDDDVTMQDVLHLVSRQKTLNFMPGEEELYNNTGYMLLAEIVKRVTGMSLNAFAQKRIFKPLGMNHTLIQESYHAVIKNLAASYQPKAGGGYEYLALSDSTVGSTGVVTDVEDMARWDENFYDARVGGKRVLSEMVRKDKLNDGQINPYASGLNIGEYRGLKTYQHSGAIAGYRSFYLRFPDRRFSVILLSNAADMDADDLSHRIADLRLGNALRTSPKRTKTKKPKVIKVDPAILKSYAGDYEFKPNDYVRISLSNDQLMAQGTGSGRVPIYPSSKTDFFLTNANVTLTFVTTSEGGEAQRFIMKKNGRETVAMRIKDDPLERFTGEFYCEELNVLYSVKLRDGKLFIRFPRGEKEMERILPDAFGMPFPIGVIQYVRGADGGYDGFKISNERARNIRFVKVEIKPMTE